MLRSCLAALVMLCLTSSVALAAASKLTVAHDATWPPMEYVDKNRNIVGYSVDYIDAVAKEAGFEVEHMNTAWDGIFAGLAGRKYDVVSSSVTITEDRSKVMDFSTPYYEVRQALITPKATEVKALEDMSGKKIGAQIGTTGYMAVKKIQGISALTFDEIGLAMAALASGRIDGVICDDPVATNYILDNAEYAEKMKVALIVPTDEPEYYGFAVAKGNKEALELLNKGIAAVKEKGIEAELIKKWMGAAAQ
ncbi:basic amino acid ABC transporter substrate-binding protein [Desulfovibrio sp. OttesenSCG-928-G11]|nr:basic amino acid ABC transporter substrate-binding protein [Desulfovibrio sp. OttesenSCG-928-G11]